MPTSRQWVEGAVAALRQSPDAVTDPHAYLQRTLTVHRARPREHTVFTSAGRQTIRTNGERVIVHPHTGRVIARVVESREGSTQIEEADRLHAVARPRTVTSSASADRPGTFVAGGSTPITQLQEAQQHGR